MTDTHSKIKSLNETLAQHKAQSEAILYDLGDERPNSKTFAQISELSNKTDKPIKVKSEYGNYLVEAHSNIPDTAFSIIEQDDYSPKKMSDDALWEGWDYVLDDQEKSVAGDAHDYYAIAMSKEIFNRFPEYRHKLDLPQTLRLFNTLKQSNQPENKEISSVVEKDLNEKAWRYLTSGDFPIKANANIYSVSCMEELKDYLTNSIHAPENIVDAKLRNLELSTLTFYNSDNVSISKLTPKAKTLLCNTAKKYPDHEIGTKILQNISLTNQRTERSIK